MKENNKKNTAVYLWLFIFTVVIALNNLNSYIWSGTNNDLIFTGGNFLVFFMFIAGYSLMYYYKNNKNEQGSVALRSWKFTGKTFSFLYPALLGGVSLAFIVRNVITGTKLSSIFPIFINSIWEFLGLSQIGAVGLAEQTTGAVVLESGVSTLWNGPLWIISAIIISSLILYYIVSKNEDFFVGIFAPLFIIVVYASAGLTEIGWSSTSLSYIGIPNGIARVMAGMCVGMLMYYVVNYFQKKKFSESMTMLLSILHISLVMIFVYTIYNGTPWNDFANGIIILIFCTVLLINKDYISVLYNNSKICSFLGKISLYYYACHIAFAFLLSWLFPSMGYHASIIFNILFSISWAFIMMYCDDYVVTPLFRNKGKTKRKKIAS